MFKQKIFLSIVSGLLLLFSFPPFKNFYFAFFALIPLLLITNNLDLKPYLILILIFSLTVSIGLLWWTYVYNIFTLLFLIIYQTLFYTFIFLLYFYLKKNIKILNILILPIIWTSLDYFKCTGSYAFSWGTLAYTQSYFIQFIQISNILGLFGITFLVCLTNTVIAELVLTGFKNNFVIGKTIFLILLYLTIFLYGLDTIDNYKNKFLVNTNNYKTYDFGIIQPNISPYISWKENNDKINNFLINSINELSLYKSDMIILPETSIRDDLFYYSNNNLFWKDYKWKYNFSKITNISNTYLLLGNILTDVDSKGDLKYYNSSIFLSPTSKILNYYNKIHLVPFGEFVPFYKKYDFVKNIATYFGCSNFDRGKRYSSFSYKNLKFATPICYESSFPYIIRKFFNPKLDLLINITNDLWTLSKYAHKQHFTMNVFSCIENNVSMLRVGNSGVSGFITPIGTFKSLTEPMESVKKIIKVDILKNKKITFYTRYGDIFAQLCTVLMGILFFVNVFYKEHQQ